jgi:phospholipid/cholesterol/gamma-HCH transport system substrate-binding protein
MPALLKEHVAEALIGFLVVLLAIGFVVFAWDRTQAGRGDGYLLVARFPSVAGVTPGTDVRLAGIKVGRVAAERLDPETYQAVLELSIEQGVRLPVDSSAAITSEGLLGGNFIALTPGAEKLMLKPGEEILETSGAADLMGLIGSVVNRSGDAPAK